METSDVFEKDLKEGNIWKPFLDFGEINAKEISFTSDKDDGMEEGNTNMYAIKGLSDVIKGCIDNNVLETQGIYDSLVDTIEISDVIKVIAPDVEKDVIKRINKMQSTPLVSHDTSCLLESHL